MSKALNIRTEIRRAIRTGKLRTGDKLPIQNEIADQYDTGVSTVHTALKPLKEEGVIYTAHDGTFVGPRPKREETPVQDYPKSAQCYTSHCKNTFEVDRWQGVPNFHRMLIKAGWITRGSRAGLLVFCHQCAPGIEQVT